MAEAIRAGGLGHLGIQYAKVMGLQVCAVDVDDGKLALAKKVGADFVVNAKHGDPAEAVKKGTNGGAQLVAALGIDGNGDKHPLGLVEGATENTAVVQALIDNLIERGLDPTVCRLFIIDGAKALSKVIRRTFGGHTPIQRCQIHKARNVIERLPKPLHASVRRALRQAWELDDADKAERLLRNLARRLDQEAPGVAASILEGLDEMLTVNRLKLPAKLRRSLACTNSIENMMGTVRRVCRNVKRWRNAAMALRWTAAGMMEAAKGFRRLKAYRLLPILRAALVAHATEHVATKKIEPQTDAA